jgi:two-component system, LytTR family, sensor histidine kinase AlgZ
MSMQSEYPFVFSSKYRLLRHGLFWLVHILVFSFLYKVPNQSWRIQHAQSAIWAIAFIIYSYPVMYLFIPWLLLKERIVTFITALVIWGIAGYFFNYLYRKYVFFNLADFLNANMGLPLAYSSSNPWAPAGFIVMNLMAGYGSLIVLFKYWVKKQRQLLLAEKEKATAELQLLKAQIHPHFLFNTLNNIYSFSMKASPKTTEMIARLSSLLSYVLYDCKNNEVLLTKEIEVMKNYIDLEKERYGNRLDISTNIEGDIEGKFIAPLLLLPFIENAFKHGTSEQLEKPWLSIDLSVKDSLLRFKIVNSKNEFSEAKEKGIGIENVQKRLSYLYEGQYNLKLSDEGNFFVVSLTMELSAVTTFKRPEPLPTETDGIAPGEMRTAAK